MSDFYRVALEGSFAGQSVVNVLWYRSTVEVPLLDLVGSYVPALASGVRDSIWNVSGLPLGNNWDLRAVMPVAYTLERITIVGYDEGFSLISSDPYTLNVNQTGEYALAVQGVANCVNVRFNLEPVVGPGVGLPKRGYVAIALPPESGVDNTGRLENAFQSIYQSIGDKMASNIVSLVPPAVFFPIRARVTRTLGVVTDIGYKDIASASVDPLTSFRRSRRLES